MSRRLRKEVERAKELNNEAMLEEKRIKALKERVFAPLVWFDLENGIRIMDLKPNYYEEVMKMVERFYLPEEVLTRNSNVKQDEKSRKSFLYKTSFNLRNRTSIIAVDQSPEEEAVVGVLVMKAVHKADYGRVYSRTQIVSGKGYAKMVKPINTLSRSIDIFEEYECESFLKIVLCCILPYYRNSGIGLKFMESAVHVLRTLKMTVLMGVFSNCPLQAKAKQVGMKVINEIYYVHYKDRYDDLIFEDPGVGNFSCALMIGHYPLTEEKDEEEA